MSSPGISRHSVVLRTSAWFGDVDRIIEFPETHHVEVLQPVDGQSLSIEKIEEAIRKPLGPSLDSMVQGKRQITIVVDDLGRPTPAHLIVPSVLNLLLSAGIRQEGIRFLIATGSHRTLTRDEQTKKLGEGIVDQYEVFCHDAFQSEMVRLEPFHAGFPCVVNKVAVESDVLVGISVVIPHSCHGFGGGAKLFLPGIAGIESIAFLHGFTKKRGRGKTLPNGSWDMRMASESFAGRLPPIFSINTLVNSKRELCGMYAGDYRRAYAEAMRHASNIYQTSIDAEKTYDIVIVNSYPLDSDPVQSDKSQWVKKTFPKSLLIYVNSTHDALDYHGWKWLRKGSRTRKYFVGLFRSIGGASNSFALTPLRLLRNVLLRQWFLSAQFSYRRFPDRQPEPSSTPVGEMAGPYKNRFPWMLSEHYPTVDFYRKYKDGILFRDWQTLRTALEKEFSTATVGVLTCAPLQIPHRRRNGNEEAVANGESK